MHSRAPPPLAVPATAPPPPVGAPAAAVGCAPGPEPLAPWGAGGPPKPASSAAPGRDEVVLDHPSLIIRPTRRPGRVENPEPRDRERRQWCPDRLGNLQPL